MHQECYVQEGWLELKDGINNTYDGGTVPWWRHQQVLLISDACDIENFLACEVHMFNANHSETPKKIKYLYEWTIKNIVIYKIKKPYNREII